MNPSTPSSEPSARRRDRRSIKLIQPALQLRLIGWFAGMTAVALIGQFLLLSSRLTQFAAQMPRDGNYLLEGLNGLLLDILVSSFGMLLPAILLIGIHVTFRLAGPLYNFKRHLRAVADGEQIGPCRIRKGDQLQDLCALINAALERTRVDAAHTAEAEVSARLHEKERLAA